MEAPKDLSRKVILFDLSCKKDPTGCHEEIQFYLGTKKRKSDLTLKK